MKKLTKKFLFSSIAVLLLANLAGCGSSQDSDVQAKPENEDTSNSNTNSNPPQDIPIITNDLEPTNPPPPPNSQQLAEDFFRRQEIFESFSPQLQEQILNSRTPAPEDPNAPIVSTIFGELPAEIQGVVCDPDADFFCFIQPQTGFDTLNSSVAVEMLVNMDQLATAGTQDPVVFVSMFNQDTGESSEALIKCAEFTGVGDSELNDTCECSSPPASGTCLGTFSTGLGMSSFGRYVLTVSAFKVLPDGVSTAHVAKSKFGSKTSTNIQFDLNSVKVFPVVAGQVGNQEVSNGDVLNAEAVEVLANFHSLPTPGTVLLVEVLDSQGKMIAHGGARGDSPGQVTAVTQQDANGNTVVSHYVFKARVPLKNGEQSLKISAFAADIEEGTHRPVVGTTTLNLNNFRFYQFKQLSPSLVVQEDKNHQEAFLEFCYTAVPGAAGQGENGCVSQEIDFNACLEVNGQDLGEVSHNGGVFSAASIPASFGLIPYRVTLVKNNQANPCQKQNGYVGVQHVQDGVFSFGDPVYMIKDGEVQAGSFSARNVAMHIGSSLFKQNIIGPLEKVLNQEETKAGLPLLFKKKDIGIETTCYDTDPPTPVGGTTSLEFLPGEFNLGKIEIDTIEPKSDGMFHVGVKVHDFYGEVDLIGLDVPGLYDENGNQINKLALTLGMARLDINLGIKFKLDPDDNYLKLDIKKVSGKDLVKLYGNLPPYGKYVKVNTDRNPANAAYEHLENNGGALISKLFKQTLETTLICGLEFQLNHKQTGIGVIGAGVENLLDPLNKDPSIFRQVLDFDLLGNPFNLSVGYHLMGGDIKFSGSGIFLDYPTRILPDPDRLEILADQHPELAYPSRPKQSASEDSININTNQASGNHNLAIALSEDPLNQALVGLAAAGVEIKIDSNFFSQREEPIVPPLLLAPDVERLAPDVDVDFNGKYDINRDGRVPVALGIRLDPERASTVSFLTPDEVNALSAQELAASGNSEDLFFVGPQLAEAQGLEAGTYFKASLSFFWSVYKQQKSLTQPAFKRYCEIQVPQESNLPDVPGLCSAQPTALDYIEYDGSCTGDAIKTLPFANGPTISHQFSEEGISSDNPAPLYSARVQLLLHGRIVGIFNLENNEGNVQPHMIIRFADDATIQNQSLLTGTEIVVNNTNLPDNQVGKISSLSIGEALKTALGRCDNFNQIVIPIPERFPAEGAAVLLEIFQQLGIEHINLIDPDNPEATQPVVEADSQGRPWIKGFFFAGLEFSDVEDQEESDEDNREGN